jgi:hypothetical protein
VLERQDFGGNLEVRVVVQDRQPVSGWQYGGQEGSGADLGRSPLRHVFIQVSGLLTAFVMLR